MSEFREMVLAARQSRDYQQLIDLIPYARMLGIAVHEDADGELIFRLAFQKQNIGNPAMPALHGGAVGAFMEHAAIFQLLWRLEATMIPRVVDFSIDYLRPGRPEDAFACCRVWRQGQRVANVAVETWQSDRDATIATARGHFLLSRPADEA
ncbi:PaaI family thioesterase [Aquisalimonas sp.]|uniref:PaaI family thioesterase n=1 Tax=unclassified Aquisalimonas TaxID=2644645 RepID=UPI0025BA2920|nr:PaaI family thioesterase [Aquisalimonas sp.]